jgi:hypothetical protein
LPFSRWNMATLFNTTDADFTCFARLRWINPAPNKLSESARPN